MTNGIPGWMHEKDLQVMARLASGVPRAGKIVEVGSWIGQSTYTWASNTEANVYAIDLWQWMPKEYKGPHADKVDLSGDPFDQFINNVGHFTNLIPLRRNSSGGEWLHGSVDIVFIDAMHQNPWVGEDIRYWEEHVKSGGIICGDDYAKKFPDVMSEAALCAHRLGSKLETPGQKFWLVRKP